MVDLSRSAFAAVPPPPPARASAPEAPNAAGGPQAAPKGHDGTGSWPVLAYAIAAIPLGLLSILALLVPAFVAPLSDDRVSLIGLPAGSFVIALLVILAAVGILTVRFVRQPVFVGIVLTLTTMLGLTVLAFAPASIIIMINLKT